MPEPRQDEDKDAFMERCMADPEAQSDFPDQAQRSAFCHAQYSRMNTEMKRVTANMDDLRPEEAVRREVHEGTEHLVVPVVMIVEGVMNGAMVPVAEFGRHVESWNGIPVPVLHPQERGEFISANRPDVVEKNTIGRVYNARVDGDKLKAELWLNIEKARRLGHGELLDALEAGQVIEVSTGYFADDEPKAGEYNGEAYNVIQRNLKPDHLALLPGEEGACSIQDGCGTRVNSKGIAMKTKEAINTLAQALGLRANCECNPNEEGDMSSELLKKAEALKANEMLTPEQLEMIQSMDSEQLTMMEGIIDKLAEKAEKPEPEGDDSEPSSPEGAEEDLEAMKANGKAIPAEKVGELVTNEVQKALRRNSVVEKLKANESNPFSEDEMKTMSVEHLEKLEKSIRPADYSGQGGFAANSDAVDTNVTPLRTSGLVSKIKQSKEA